MQEQKERRSNDYDDDYSGGSGGHVTCVIFAFCFGRCLTLSLLFSPFLAPHYDNEQEQRGTKSSVNLW